MECSTACWLQKSFLRNTGTGARIYSVTTAEEKGFLGSTGCITNVAPAARTTPELSRPRHQIVPCRINRSADEDVDEDEVEPLPGAISFWRLFNFVDGLDWALMAAGTVAAAAHDAAFVVYMH